MLSAPTGTLVPRGEANPVRPPPHPQTPLQNRPTVLTPGPPRATLGRPPAFVPGPELPPSFSTHSRRLQPFNAQHFEGSFPGLSLSAFPLNPKHLHFQFLYFTERRASGVTLIIFMLASPPRGKMLTFSVFNASCGIKRDVLEETCGCEE